MNSIPGKQGLAYNSMLIKAKVIVLVEYCKEKFVMLYH